MFLFYYFSGIFAVRVAKRELTISSSLLRYISLSLLLLWLLFFLLVFLSTLVQNICYWFLRKRKKIMKYKETWLIRLAYRIQKKILFTKKSKCFFFIHCKLKLGSPVFIFFCWKIVWGNIKVKYLPGLPGIHSAEAQIFAIHWWSTAW